MFIQKIKSQLTNKILFIRIIHASPCKISLRIGESIGHPQSRGSFLCIIHQVVSDEQGAKAYQADKLYKWCSDVKTRRDQVDRWSLVSTWPTIFRAGIFPAKWFIGFGGDIEAEGWQKEMEFEGRQEGRDRWNSTIEYL